MHAGTYRRALGVLVTTLGMLAAATVIAAPAQADPICPMTYKVVDFWPATGSFPAGFTGTFTLTNKSTTKTTGWRVEVHFRAGVEVTVNWGSEMILDADPVYVFGNVGHNREIGPGGSTQFGVNATKTADTISSTPLSYVCAPIW